MVEGFLHAKLRLLGKRKRVFKHFSIPNPAQKWLVQTIRWTMERLVKICCEVIVLQRLIGLRQMVLQNDRHAG